MAEVYNNNKKYDRKKKLKSLTRFHSTNKMNNYDRVGGKEEKEKIQKNLWNKSNHKNNKCFS